ncbi:GntR family transcriptional regulator [Olivibacter ginsenosidimutans]|uniref:GntR family transcriptional regulator n=1 Tax=Olivibacter ginsenosidimutans TaxID=1176537 RepID=A0ABP9AYZ1_9SPHI
MEFRDNKAIYLQIIDYVFEQILLGKWCANEKISSVRDLAAQLEVNPNTVARSYEMLQNQEVIQNKRGIGFFVCANALEKIRNQRREEFKIRELPEIFRSIYLLGIDFDQLKEAYHDFINTINLQENENK